MVKVKGAAKEALHYKGSMHPYPGMYQIKIWQSYKILR